MLGRIEIVAPASLEVAQASQAAEKLQFVIPREDLVRGICFFVAICKEADPSVAAATSG
jgi:hypothetical protein